MNRLLLAVVVALGVTSPAYAQIAAAIGKPLSSPDLPPGTVTVRVVAGSAANPVVGTTVTMVVNGTPREARTDDAGRATFNGLPVGATVQATVLDEDKKEVKSDEFQVADGNGARLMLTTKPWQGGGGGGGAPFAGGGGGMPEPRQMSGEARGEQQDPPGQITVRVTYDDFKDTPEGVAVVLVGYASDDSTTYQVQKTDKAGRVVFDQFPTGVEVVPSMVHGGPFPASSDAGTTSVGTRALERFTRLVAFQNAPAALLPPELLDKNPGGLLRMINGTWTRDPILP